MTRNELQIIEHWKGIFDLVENSGERPKDWCQRNGIEFEEFRQYACIFERQKSCVIRGEITSKFEVRAIEGTPFVEVPFMSRKSIKDITNNPWAEHNPSLVISSDKLHCALFGDYTEEKIRAVMRGVFMNA